MTEKTDAELAEEIERHLLAYCAGVPTPVIGIDIWAWKRIIAALRRQPSSDMVLVPREPTKKMISAAHRSQWADKYGNEPTLQPKAVWSAMLVAAEADGK